MNVYDRWRIIGLLAEKEIKEDWEGKDVGHMSTPAVSNAAFRQVPTYGFRNRKYDLVQQMKSEGCALHV